MAEKTCHALKCALPPTYRLTLHSYDGAGPEVHHFYCEPHAHRAKALCNDLAKALDKPIEMTLEPLEESPNE